MSAVNFPAADFHPQLAGYTGQGAFRFWCQKVLPLVYDDSLSYYELLAKVVVYLNNVIKDFGTMADNLDEVIETFEELQSYVNNYLDIQSAVDKKLDELVEDGTFDRIFKDDVAREVDQWLDEHPEATTTVQDKSIGENKFTQDVYDKIYRTFEFSSLEQTSLKTRVANRFNRMYDEGMTYNPITGKFLIAYRNYSVSPERTDIVSVDPDTGAIDGTWSYPFSPVITLNYDSINQKIMATAIGSTQTYLIDANDMESYEAVTMPGIVTAKPAWAYDEVTNKYIHCELEMDEEYTAYTGKMNVHIFSRDLVYEKTVVFNLDSNIDTPAQGFCAVDGRVYQVTWNSIIVGDYTTGKFIRIRLRGIMELEDITNIGKDLYMCGHWAAGRWCWTSIYGYSLNVEPPQNTGVPQRKSRVLENLSLTDVLGDGIYTARITDGTASNIYYYPSLSITEGTLIVVGEYSGNGNWLIGATQYFIPTDHSNIYVHHFKRYDDPYAEHPTVINQWTNWTPTTMFEIKIDVTNNETQTEYDNRYGFVTIPDVGGDFTVLSVDVTTPANTTGLLSYAAPNHRFIACSFYSNGTYLPVTSGRIVAYVRYAKRMIP